MSNCCWFDKINIIIYIDCILIWIFLYIVRLLKKSILINCMHRTGDGSVSWRKTAVRRHKLTDFCSALLRVSAPRRGWFQNSPRSSSAVVQKARLETGKLITRTPFLRRISRQWMHSPPSAQDRGWLRGAQSKKNKYLY